MNIKKTYSGTYEVEAYALPMITAKAPLGRWIDPQSHEQETRGWLYINSLADAIGRISNRDRFAWQQVAKQRLADVDEDYQERRGWLLEQLKELDDQYKEIKSEDVYFYVLGRDIVAAPYTALLNKCADKKCDTRAEAESYIAWKDSEAEWLEFMAS